MQRIVFESVSESCLSIELTKNSLSILCRSYERIHYTERASISDAFGPLQVIYQKTGSQPIMKAVLSADRNHLLWLEGSSTSIVYYAPLDKRNPNDITLGSKTTIATDAISYSSSGRPIFISSGGRYAGVISTLFKIKVFDLQGDLNSPVELPFTNIKNVAIN